MHTQTNVTLFLRLAKIQAKLTRKFDNSLNGLSLSEFSILLHLSHAEEQKMRRIDLAEKVGLTASGITRLLLPMEKIGLVKKEADKNDARSSFVVLASGGKTKLADGLERAELLSQDLLANLKPKEVKELSELLVGLDSKLI